MNEDCLLPDHLLTGNEINYIRFILKLNQKEFAEKIGVTIATVSQWEYNGAGIIQARYPIQAMIKLLYADYCIPDDKKFREIARKLFHVKKIISKFYS